MNVTKIIYRDKDGEICSKEFAEQNPLTTQKEVCLVKSKILAELHKRFSEETVLVSEVEIFLSEVLDSR